MHAHDPLADCDFGLTHAQQAEVKEVLLHAERRQRDEQLALQRQAAAARGERIVKRFGSDLRGYTNLSISPYLYHKLGRFYGYQCWEDDDFLRAVWKHYPETRVITRSEKPTVTVLADVPARNVKFSKSYACAA